MKWRWLHSFWFASFFRIYKDGQCGDMVLPWKILHHNFIFDYGVTSILKPWAMSGGEETNNRKRDNRWWEKIEKDERREREKKLTSGNRAWLSHTLNCRSGVMFVAV